MKKVGLWGGILFFAAVVLAIVVAMQTGETSPILASGKIRLDPGLEEKAQGIRTLYIVVYDSDSPMPMPYGAMKETLDEDPKAGDFLDFAITKERLQVMGGAEMPPPKNLRLKVRLDRDGLAGMDQPGDLVGSQQVVALGTRDVNINIDQSVQ